MVMSTSTTRMRRFIGNLGRLSLRFSALAFLFSRSFTGGSWASRIRNGMIIPRSCPAGDVDTPAGPFLSLSFGSWISNWVVVVDHITGRLSRTSAGGADSGLDYFLFGFSNILAII